MVVATENACTASALTACCCCCCCCGCPSTAVGVVPTIDEATKDDDGEDRVTGTTARMLEASDVVVVVAVVVPPVVLTRDAEGGREDERGVGFTKATSVEDVSAEAEAGVGTAAAAMDGLDGDAEGGTPVNPSPTMLLVSWPPPLPPAFPVAAEAIAEEEEVEAAVRGERPAGRPCASEPGKRPEGATVLFIVSMIPK